MKEPLQNYFDILKKRKKPRFKSARLDTKIKSAQEILKKCTLCERKCRVNRLKGEKGFCRVDDKTRISSMFTHYGEEPFLVPSFTIFFWSCTFSCQFCQNWSISQRVEEPAVLEPKKIAEIIDRCNCKNINVVGGDPVPYLPRVLEILKQGINS